MKSRIVKSVYDRGSGNILWIVYFLQTKQCKAFLFTTENLLKTLNIKFDKNNLDKDVIENFCISMNNKDITFQCDSETIANSPAIEEEQIPSFIESVMLTYREYLS